MNKTSELVFAILLGFFMIAAVSVFSNPTSMEIFNASANPSRCTDTDGGIRVYEPGTVKGYYMGSYFENKDYCTGNNTLNEYYCYSGRKNAQIYSCGSDAYKSYNYCKNDSVYKRYRTSWCENGACKYRVVDILQERCAYGCSDGICMAPKNITNSRKYQTSVDSHANFSCQDTDNGINAISKGVVSGYSNGVYYSKIDSCSGNATVMEWYCSSSGSGKAAVTTSSCPFGKMCIDGACI